MKPPRVDVFKPRPERPARPERKDWTSGDKMARKRLRRRVRQAMQAGDPLASLLEDWDPRRCHRARRMMLRWARREASDLAAYLRSAPNNAGDPPLPWWHDASVGLDRERYPWDADDLPERLARRARAGAMAEV